MKLYAYETDTPYFVQLATGAKEQILTSAVASTELLCAFERKERNGDFRSGGANAAFDQYLMDTRRGRIIEIPYSRDVVEEARKLLNAVTDPRILIRSLDMIHVASAIAAKAGLIAATDLRLRRLAAFANIKLLPK